MLQPLAILFGALFVVLSGLAFALKRWASWWPWVFGAAASALVVLVLPWEYIPAEVRLPLGIAIVAFYVTLAWLTQRWTDRITGPPRRSHDGPLDN